MVEWKYRFGKKGGTMITLKAARINANLTQLEASEKLGVSLPTLQRWEQNPSKVKERNREFIAKNYGIPLELLKWEE